MAVTDLVLARDVQQLRSWEHAERAVEATQRVEERLREQFRGQERESTRLVASFAAIEELERRNSSLLLDLGLGLGCISDQLADGFSTLATQSRFQSEALSHILETLQNPSTVQAAEFRTRGLYARENGWLEEAAAQLNKAAEFNPFDFTVLQVLGDLAMSPSEDPETAATFYLKAARYATPVSTVDAALAWLSASRAQRDAEDIANALASAKQAQALVPEMPETHYAVGRLEAIQGLHEEAVDDLVRAFDMRLSLCALSLDDPDLRAVDSTLERALTRTRDKIRRAVEEATADPTRTVQDAGELISSLRSQSALAAQGPERWEVEPALERVFADFDGRLGKIRQKAERDTIEDLDKARAELQALGPELDLALTAAINRQAEEYLPAEVVDDLTEFLESHDLEALTCLACDGCGSPVLSGTEICPSCGLRLR